MTDRAEARLPRPKSILPLLALAALITAALVYSNVAGAKPSQARVDPTERRVIEVINQVRQANGLKRVTASRRLSRSADDHSRDMLKRDFFAHTSSNGTSMGTRVRRYRRATRIGENIAHIPRSWRHGVARRVVALWLSSPSHRAVILSPGFRKIGVARRKGRLGDDKAQVFTSDFSSRR